MAYETGTATSMSDLLTKINTFAVANGWTSDQLNTGAGQVAIHKSNIYVSFRWNTTTPNTLGIYQALGYTGGNQPGQHPNDSGNGAVSTTDATLAGERSVVLGNGAFPSYFIFADTNYLHIVVETTTDIYRHFGFGLLEKIGDWTGGEYCYGQTHLSSGNALSTSSTALLDALHVGASNRERSSTIHLEALPGMAGASKWGEISGNSVAPSNDPAGNARVLVRGGFRGGPVGRQFGFYSGGNTSGLIPMYPIGIYYRNLANSNCYWLGYQPAVRGINVRSFTPKQEITIGADTWTVFPVSERTLSATANRTYFQGIAYKKIP